VYSALCTPRFFRLAAHHYVKNLSSGGFERATSGGATSSGTLPQTCRLAGRHADPPPPPHARRQRKAENSDGPFNGVVFIQSLAEDARTRNSERKSCMAHGDVH
jgi:hypothetical protein